MSSPRLNKINLVFILLPLTALINDAILVEVANIFVTPYKVALLVSSLILFKPFLFLLSKKNKPLSGVSVFFIFYCLFLWVSVIYSNPLTISQKINYCLFITCEIIIVLGCTYKIKSTNITDLIKSFNRVLLLIFFLSLFLSTAQFILKDQLIYTGLFATRKITYAITGFNLERLFLCEFLILGLAIILFFKLYSVVLRVTLFLWVGFLIFYTASFTGILGFTGLIVIATRKMNFKRFILYASILIISVFVFDTINNEGFFTSKIESSEKKFDSYYTNASEENWRYISSMALIKDVYSKPTLIGHGYMSSKVFLKDINYAYSLNKYGISKATYKENTSHTFVSVLYDQGFFGFLILIVFIIKLILMSIKLYRLREVHPNSYLNITLKITLVLAVLVLLRFSFYYHTINHWHYLLLIIFSNILLIKRITINKM